MSLVCVYNVTGKFGFPESPGTILDPAVTRNSGFRSRPELRFPEPGTQGSGFTSNSGFQESFWSQGSLSHPEDTVFQSTEIRVPQSTSSFQQSPGIFRVGRFTWTTPVFVSHPELRFPEVTKITRSRSNPVSGFPESPGKRVPEVTQNSALQELSGLRLPGVARNFGFL